MNQHNEIVEIETGAAAQRLGITRERVVRLVQTGRLRGERRDGRYYVEAQDVERLARELKRKAVHAGTPARRAAAAR